MQTALKVAEVQEPTYDPDNLLDVLISHLKVKNDAGLARALEIGPPVISKIRHRKLGISAAMLIRMNEVSGIGIRDLRDLMGDRRGKFRMSAEQFKPSDR